MSGRAFARCAVTIAAATLASFASADVLNMGAGLTSLETVHIGDTSNAGDSRYGGYGSVPYEYNIGKYEVTAAQYCEFLNAVAKTDTYELYNVKMDALAGAWGCNIKRSGSPGSYTYSVASDYANRPVNYVSFWDACRFSNWLHNGQPTGEQGPGTTETGAYTLDGYTGADGRTIERNADWRWALPSEDEWYKAAYYDPNKPGGAGYWDYPTGSNSAPGRDMTESTSPGNNANYWSSGYMIGDPYYRTPVGEFELSDSPYGTFDQGGNVWEWNEAIVYQGANYASRCVRGASFNDGQWYLEASRRDYFANPWDENTHLGFRVVQVPEPVSLIVLAGGALALLRRRSR